MMTGLSRCLETKLPAAIDLLIKWLPGPCSALVLGCGDDLIIEQLVALGYRVKSASTNLAGFGSLVSTLSEHTSNVESGTDRFEPIIGRLDLLICQDSFKSLDALDFFSAVSSLLSPIGEIVFFNKSLGDDVLCGSFRRSHSARLLPIADRFGFDVVDAIEFSECAQGRDNCSSESLFRLQSVLTQSVVFRQDRVKRKRILTESKTQQFGTSDACYWAIKLRRIRQPKQIPGWVRSVHFDELKQVFANSFNAPISRELWEWKYGDSRGKGVGVWEDGILVAHYGGLSRPVLYFGEPQLASQSADVMAIPAARRSLVRKSPFFIAAATYLELTTGFDRPHLLGFGFPNERARRAPELLGLYSKPVSKMIGLSWCLSRSDIRSRFFRRWRLDLSVPADAAVVDDCWRRMSSTTEQFIIGIRDADWLTHRYLKHPHNNYDIFAVALRGQSRPFGIFVLKIHPGDVYELIDIVAEPLRIKWLMIAVKGIFDSDYGRIFTWVSEPMAVFFPSNFEKTDLKIGIPSCIWTEGPHASKLIDRWWLMGGDTDFL